MKRNPIPCKIGKICGYNMFGLYVTCKCLIHVRYGHIWEITFRHIWALWNLVSPYMGNTVKPRQHNEHAVHTEYRITNSDITNTRLYRTNVSVP